MKKFRFNENINEFEIDHRCIEEGVKFAEKKNYPAIRIVDLKEDGKARHLDLSPLSGNTFIESLSISDDVKISKVSLEALYSMESLTKLSFQDKKIQPDYSKLSNLQVLYMKFSDLPTGFSCLEKMTDLLITSLNHENCSFFDGLHSLKELRLSGGTIKTLSGIEKAVNLMDVKMDHCSKLHDISSLSALKNLKNVHIEKCKLVTDFSCLTDNTTITHLFASTIDSISFVPTMPQLTSLHFWDLTDGDLNPLLETKLLKEVDFYPNKKHYSYTREEINSLLEKRHPQKIS
jgi:internalin A